MQVSNDDIARILGRMEAKLDAQGEATGRLEKGLANLEEKQSRRLDEHNERIRALELTKPAEIAKQVDKHEERIAALERGAAKAGMVAGTGSAIGMGILVELIKRKLGL